MSTSECKSPAMENRRWAQFSLRSMLVLTAGIALLLSQYPFFELVPLTYLGNGAGANPRMDVIIAPTKGFVLVAVLEIAVLVAWLGYRHTRVNWARRATQRVGGD